MDFDIQFRYNGKRFKLVLLESVEIESNVEVLVDTAVIKLPEAVLNQVLNIGDKIGRGAEVTIDLGYDGNLVREFEGFVQDIQTNDSSLKIMCEDALFLFRKDVANEQLKTTSVSKIVQRMIDQVDSSFTLVCDFDLGYEKFTIHQATAYDVLKKIAEETKANIYFVTDKKELHVRFPFKEKGGEVKYSFQRNIEKSSLEYKRAIDKKVEVTVESISNNGTIKSITAGTTGGDKITIKTGAMSESDMKTLADAELVKRNADGYQGSFDAWLIPIVRPTYTARIKDEDYPEKDGQYYVKAVKTLFSSSGGVRTVNVGVKLG